jgi:chromosome segregation ATPase
MIAVIMYCAIGFLTATLLALLTLPAVWRRAVRLTRKRIENALPVSMAEIQADKDEQRAEFAVAVRRLEMDVQQLQERTSDQWGQITRQAEELRARQARIDDTTARLAALEAAHAELAAHDRQVTDDLAIRSRDLEETQASLAATRKELAATARTLEQTSAREEELKVEHIALTTLRDTLKDRITDLDRHLSAANAHLATERETLRVTSESLSIEVSKNREMRDLIAEAERELSTVSAEAATLRAELATLHLRADSLEDRTRKAEARRDAVEQEAARVTTEALAARESAESSARQANDLARMLQAEKSMLEGALAQAREDRAALQGRLDALPPTIAAARDDGNEAAQLRERISDIAAEVASLTAALEGPGSPIDALLAASAPPRKGAPPTLAERIRALREKAMRDTVEPKDAEEVAAAPRRTKSRAANDRAVAG